MNRDDQSYSPTFSGLTQKEITARILAGQTNRTEKFTTRTIPEILRYNVLTIFNGIIFVSLIALLAIGAYIDVLLLAAVTVINTLTGVVEEIRAKLALDRLALLGRHNVSVIREHKIQNIPAEEVVQDEVISFQSGDQIIADGILLSSTPAYLDESLLTGEADTIKKNRNDALLAGSFCVAGSGVYKATHVGSLSSINQLAEQAKKYKIDFTPIQKDIGKIIQFLTAIMILFAALLVLADYIKNSPISSSVLSVVTVIKSLVPQGLILMSTMAFAFGAIRVAKKKVLVQKLNAIESMSHVSVLCFDKTGTLGTNSLKFDSLKIFPSVKKEDVINKLKLFVGAVSDKNRTINAIAEKFVGLPSTVVDEILFLSREKSSAVRVRHKGATISLWLGAPEMLEGKKFPPNQQTTLDNLRNKGLRVLLFASSLGPLSQRKKLLTYLAFVVLKDELRPDLHGAIKFYENRNVRLKILSGDHPDTIASIAKQAGMNCYGNLVDGRELLGLKTKELKKSIISGQFFGNLTPQQKKQIISYLQEAGEYVGMVGDGINDILALKQANIGIAMNSGTAATRDVSDIILLESNFTHLPALSQEGDRIIYNIKRVTRLFLAKNVYALFFILFVGFIGLTFPLSPRFITWIDILTIGGPTTILMLLMPQLQKQKSKTFIYDSIKFAATSGLVIAFFSLLVYANFYLFQDKAGSYGRTAGVSVIILMGLYLVFKVTAAERKTSARGHNYVVWGIIIGGCLMNFIAVYWPWLCTLVGLTPLDADSWITILLASFSGMALINWLLKNYKALNVI